MTDVGQRWVQILTGRTMRIMAIAENYAMCRYKGGMPFVIPLNEIPMKFVLNEQKKPIREQEDKRSVANTPNQGTEAGKQKT